MFASCAKVILSLFPEKLHQWQASTPFKALDSECTAWKDDVYVIFCTGQVLATVENGSEEWPGALRGSGQRTLQCYGLYRLLQV